MPSSYSSTPKQLGLDNSNEIECLDLRKDSQVISQSQSTSSGKNKQNAMYRETQAVLDELDRLIEGDSPEHDNENEAANKVEVEVAMARERESTAADTKVKTDAIRKLPEELYTFFKQLKLTQDNMY